MDLKHSIIIALPSVINPDEVKQEHYKVADKFYCLVEELEQKQDHTLYKISAEKQEAFYVLGFASAVLLKKYKLPETFYPF